MTLMRHDIENTGTGDGQNAVPANIWMNLRFVLRAI